MSGKCKFNKEWLNLYDWIEEVKDEKEKAKCKLCNSMFSVSNKGHASITQHRDTVTHRNNANLAAKTVAIDKSKSLIPLVQRKDSKTAAKEATFVYHLIKEGQSFRSATCTSKLICKIFGKNPEFKCSETKAEAIATGVLAPLATSLLLDEIRDIVSDIFFDGK